MSVRHSMENLPSANMTNFGVCAVCCLALGNLVAIVATECKHNFHKSCLLEWIEKSATCPQCRAVWTYESLIEFQTPTDLNLQIPTLRNSQGAVPKKSGPSANNANVYQTRSKSKNLYQNTLQKTAHGADLPNHQFSLPITIGGQEPLVTPSQNLNQTISNIVESQVQPQFSRLENLILGLTTRLGELNIPTEPEWPQQMFPTIQATNSNIPRPTENLRQIYQNSLPNSNRQYSTAISSTLTNSSRVAHLIQSWNISFNGILSKISVDKFIYMVGSLMNVSLGGDFQTLCEHIHILFSEKGSDWFWPYRKTVAQVEWSHLCQALRSYFHDHLSDTDLREMIRDRMQKETKSFEDFYQAILYLTDRLKYPIIDQKLVEILRRNLKPSLKKELFYLEIKSVAQLRRLMLRREALSDDLDKINSRSFRRQIHEVELSPIEEYLKDSLEVDEINRNKFKSDIGKKNGVLTCWNCREEGQRFMDCLSERTVFCYGCGEPDVYKPKCIKCQAAGNLQKSENNNTSFRSNQKL